MVRSTIRRLAEQMPEHGLALHGTTVKNIGAIKRDGLTTQVVYVCPLPPAIFTEKTPEKEILERAVGSVLFAGSYAVRSISKPHLSPGELPAIVILKGSENYPFNHGYDHYPQDFGAFRKRQYGSFGKTFFLTIPPEHVVAVVQITPEEHGAIREKHGVDNIAAKTAVNRLLTRKTLAAVRKVIEAEAKK